MDLGCRGIRFNLFVCILKDDVNMRKNIASKYIPMAITAIFIVIFTVQNACLLTGEKPYELWYLAFKTMPMLITLYVQLLLIDAKRHAFLLSGLNAVIYSIVYFIEGVPFSAIYALFVSAPLSIYAFFNWKHNSKKGQTRLRHLKPKGLLLVFLSIIAIWGICYGWLSGCMAVRIAILDTAIFAIGLAGTFLMSIRYIEAQYMAVVSNTVSLIMWIVLTISNRSNVNYVIIGIYNLYCVIQAAINWTTVERKLKKEEENEVRK